MRCSICNKEITNGNSAYPVNLGKCCDTCNLIVVVPARIKLSRIKVGSKIRINKMLDEDYDGTIGVVDLVDDAGQIHGSWGSCALIPGVDDFDIIG